MRLTFATDDQADSVDIDAEMELGDIMALLEAETDIPASDQGIFHDGNHLSNPKRTLAGYNVKEDDMLILKNLRDPSTSTTGAAVSNAQQQFVPPSGDDAAEVARAQILGNPDLLRQLQEAEPEIAQAAMHNPTRFRELYNARGERYRRMQDEKKQMEESLMADPFDVEAQRKIEEMIRQEQVLENMEHAMEFSPESFGRVHMLYVNVEVNGRPVKAFVDSGAQATIISPECAEQCNIMRLLDTRFSGIARGVGTARILGRIHSAQIKVGDQLFLPVAFTVMEGKGVDLLFGLDMLKRYQATIDLEKNCLRIQGHSVRFLDEHELPRGIEEELEVDEHGNVRLPTATPSAGAAMGAAAAASAQAHAPPATNATSRFPGSGNSLSNSTPIPAQPAQAPTSPQARSPVSGTARSRWPETSIAALIGLGVSRPEAERFLDATGGNVDAAASLIFS